MNAAAHWTVLLPEVALVGGALLLLLMDAASPSQRGVHLAVITLATLGTSAVLAYGQWGHPVTSALSGMVVGDNFGVFARWIILGAGALATLTAPGYLRPRMLDRAEFYALLLLSTAGMTLLAVSADLIMVFLAVELLSLALYVMAGFERGRLEAQEASMKYFLLGAFASAFLLYGIAFVFGGTGSTNLLRARALASVGGFTDFRLVGLAVALLAVGLGFKAAMVPFHMWTPDAYQGAPAPIAGFMAAAVKAAAFAAFLRVFLTAFAQLWETWGAMVFWLAVITMVVANLIALVEPSVKRMLAYSSVSHAGYLLVALAAASTLGTASFLFYLIVYTLMTVGAFAVLLAVAGPGEEWTDVEAYSGLGWRNPMLGVVMTIFLLSLAGFPFTGGFIGKVFILRAAVEKGFVALAIVLVLASLVSYWYYLRVAWYMWFRDAPAEGGPVPEMSGGLQVVLVAAAALVVLIGVFPGTLLDLAQKSAATLVQVPNVVGLVGR